jgi:hypothetical protein
MGNDASEFYTPPVREAEPQVLLRDYDHRIMPYQLDFSGTLKPQLPGLAFSKPYSASGISGTMLSSNPRARKLHFGCLRCSELVYDGGLCKTVVCTCGSVLGRREDDSVSFMEALDPTQFSSLFKTCNNRLPPNVPLTELRSLTLGVFSDSTNASLRTHGEVDHQRVLSQCIVPYFSQAQRCVGIGDYFETPDCGLKVLGCQPNFGLVTKQTQLILYQTMHCSPLERIHVLPVQPNSFSDDFIRTALLPFLRTGAVHLHSGQTIVIRQIVCVVVAATPDNGLVIPGTQVYTQGEPLASIADLSITASIETIPTPLRSLTRAQVSWALLHLYIVPHYRGWMRPSLEGYHMRLEGINFKIARSWPQFGVVTEFTRMTCEVVVPSSQVVRMIDPNTGQLMSMLIMPGSAPSRPRGVDPEVLASLPERHLESVPTSEDNRKCMVCLEDYEVGAHVKTLPCCKW